MPLNPATATGLNRQLAQLESDILSLAKALPAERYPFAPADGMRCFADQLKHLATVVYLTAALVRQEQSPYAPGAGNNGPPEIEDKEAVIGFVRGAFVYAHQTLDQLSNSATAEQVLTYFGPQPRAEVFSGIIYHSYNHYGQMVVYARLCGVVPPNSFPA